MTKMTLGKYMPYNSPIHKLDPRVKILTLIFLMVPIFLSFPNPETSFILYGVMAIVIYIIMRMSHVRLSMIFKQLKALWVMMLFVSILNILFIKDTKYGFIAIGNQGFIIAVKALYDTLYIIIRLVLMVSLTTILTATTKPLDLTFALEWYLTPLKVFHFPTSEVAMTMTLALRFIPTFLEDTERIMKAQSSRGVDFEHGKLMEKLRAMVSLIVPLLSSAIHRSDDLADALEARGYNPDHKRTHYRQMKWGFKDTGALLLSLVFFAGFITLAAMKIDVFSWIKGWF